MSTTGECLGRRGQRRVSRRAGQHKPPWGAIAIELRLDRVEHLWHMLELVDQHGSLASHEQRRVGSHRVARGEVVEIDDLAILGGRQLPQQSQLPHGARALQHNNWLGTQTETDHCFQPTVNDLVKDHGHTCSISLPSAIRGHFLPQSEPLFLRDSKLRVKQGRLGSHCGHLRRMPAAEPLSA